MKWSKVGVSEPRMAQLKAGALAEGRSVANYLERLLDKVLGPPTVRELTPATIAEMNRLQTMDRGIVAEPFEESA
jgi:hypothetical protein